jgi:hypothetical protein
VPKQNAKMKYLRLIISWEEGFAPRNFFGEYKLACSYTVMPTTQQLREIAESRQKFGSRWVRSFITLDITEKEFNSYHISDRHNFA